MTAIKCTLKRTQGKQQEMATTQRTKQDLPGKDDGLTEKWRQDRI